MDSRLRGNDNWRIGVNSTRKVQFQVPQFIEIEDKVIGPFTFRQFIYLLGGAGGGFAIYRIVPSPLSYLLIVPIVGFAAALAFYKVNERPFATIVESWFKFKMGTKRYLWKKESRVTGEEMGALEQRIGEAGKSKPIIPKLTSGKLKDIAWSLDITERIK